MAYKFMIGDRLVVINPKQKFRSEKLIRDFARLKNRQPIEIVGYEGPPSHDDKSGLYKLKDGGLLDQDFAEEHMRLA